MHFELTFEDTQDNELQIKHEVIPVAYQQALILILPIKQKFLVYDGHDVNAHHRRFNYEFKPIKDLGFKSNFMRYAHDFVVIDEKGQQHSGSGGANTDWFGFGKEVVAVGAGKVVALQTYLADDKTFDVSSLVKDPLALYGNYIIIEHSPGVYSLYGHLKQNSVSVKTGERIKQGQKIGEIGTSGSSFFPHLHFEMRNGLDHSAEGLPAYFSNFNFIRGSVVEKAEATVVDTGDIVKSN
jgi:murein DD-endopeptidase MepM/ murein hydrolase activator NlpD